MLDALDGRRAEAKRAIGTTLLMIDYATAGDLKGITAALERINRTLAQRAKALRAEMEAAPC